jgi:Fe-S cluster assembly protein SufD
MSIVAFKIDPDKDVFQKDYVAHAAGLPGAGLYWLEARRAKAMEAFGKTGVPNRRVEAWKYTDLSSALEDNLEPAAKFDGAAGNERIFAGIPGSWVSLVSGFVHRIERSTPDGLEIVDLSTLNQSTPDWIKGNLGILASGVDQPLGAASLGLMRGGVAIRVRGNGTLHLSHFNPGRGCDWAAHSRILIVVEDGAQLRLFESHSGESGDRALANIGMEIVLKPNAKLHHVRLQAESASTLHIASIGGTLERDAEYRALYAALGAKLARVDVNLRLADKGAHAAIHNVAVLNEGIADTTTVMDHASPHTTSRQLFKSVVGGHGRSVNQGRVTVREGAVKSDSHQLFKALLLGPRAEADAKPELEIFADDVICGHGTAIGALEADALFYLRARGIPEAEAKGLLIRAFLEDAIQEFADETVHAALWTHLDAALATTLGRAG